MVGVGKGRGRDRVRVRVGAKTRVRVRGRVRGRGRARVRGRARSRVPFLECRLCLAVGPPQPPRQGRASGHLRRGRGRRRLWLLGRAWLEWRQWRVRRGGRRRRGGHRHRTATAARSGARPGKIERQPHGGDADPLGGDLPHLLVALDALGVQRVQHRAQQRQLVTRQQQRARLSRRRRGRRERLRLCRRLRARRRVKHRLAQGTVG